MVKILAFLYDFYKEKEATEEDVIQQYDKTSKFSGITGI